MAGEESPEERVNRELIELLNEARVVLPGVQVLFAFLLAVAVSNSLIIGGIAVLGVALVGVVMLVSDVLFEPSPPRLRRSSVQ